MDPRFFLHVFMAQARAGEGSERKYSVRNLHYGPRILASNNYLFQIQVK